MEDDPATGLLLRRAVTKRGHSAEVAEDGHVAVGLLKTNQYDAVLIDLVLPGLDGFAVLAQAKASQRTALLLVATAHASAETRQKAQSGGAQDVIVKPYLAADVVNRLEASLQAPSAPVAVVPRASSVDFYGVGITAGAGGPLALMELLKGLPRDLPAALFLVQQGPEVVLSTLTSTLANACGLKVRKAADGETVVPGTIYVAPAEKHLVVEAGPVVRLTEDAPVNFLRPSADPLFDSLATVFGSRAVALVLSGLGTDGRKGAQTVGSAGGRVLALDPLQALHPAMPQNVLNLGLTSQGQSLAQLAGELSALPAGR